MIYTSGSTGTPKGVGVTHANLVNYATFIAARLGADAEPMSFGVVTSISTDLGNTSVFGALCSGGTVVLISPVVAADSGALAAQLEKSPVDVLKITPSHLGALLAGGDAGVLPRRWLVIGGERAPWDLVERVRGLSEVSHPQPLRSHRGDDRLLHLRGDRRTGQVRAVQRAHRGTDRQRPLLPARRQQARPCPSGRLASSSSPERAWRAATSASRS